MPKQIFEQNLDVLVLFRAGLLLEDSPEGGAGRVEVLLLGF